MLYFYVKVQCVKARRSTGKILYSAPFVVGFGLVRFMQRYEFGQHVVFSLLIGRPLAIVAKAEQQDELLETAIALTFFLLNSVRLVILLSCSR